MKNVAEAKRLIAEKHQMIVDAQAGLRNLLEDVVMLFAPVKVGDIIKVTGAAHTGRKMKVHTIEPLYSSFTGEMRGFKAKGHILKGNGEPSFTQTAHSEYPFTDPF